MNHGFELFTETKAVEILSTSGKAKRMAFCSVSTPQVKVEVIDGVVQVSLTSKVAEHPDKDWNGIPKLAYNREAEVRLGPATCEALLQALNDAGLLKVSFAKPA